MARVEGWFERYGAVTVFFTRMLPIVRTFISTPPRAAHMNFWKFTIYTAAGCIPWVLLLGYIGVQVGANWEEWRDKLHYFDYVVVAGLIALAVWALVKWRSSKADREGEVSPPPRADFQVPAGDEGPGDSATILPSRAVALGAVQGPTELLPVSSSAHLTLVPWLGNWEWERLDPELRKSFEVALHVGAALALLVGQRRVIAEELRSFDRRKAEVLALSFRPGPPSDWPSSARSSTWAAAADRPGTSLRAPGRWRWPTAGPRAGCAARRRGRRPGAGPRPGGRAGARPAQRGDPDGRPLAGVHPRARQHALTHGCPAGDRGGCGAEGLPPAQARPRPRPAIRLRSWDGHVLRLHPGLAGVDPVGRARRLRLRPYAAYRVGLASLVLGRLSCAAAARAQAAATVVVGNGRPTPQAAHAATQAAETVARAG